MAAFLNILVASDGLSEDRDALKQGLSQARNNRAALTLVVACPALPSALAAHQRSLEKALSDRVRADLEAVAGEIKVDLASIAVKIEIDAGDRPGTRLIQRVIRNGHDLLVKQAALAADGKGFLAADMELLRKCPCPVWLCRPIARHRNEIRVAAAIDPTNQEQPARDLAVRILRVAGALAAECNGRLLVMSCWDFFHERYLTRNPWYSLSDEDVRNYIDATAAQHRTHLDEVVKAASLAVPVDVEHARGSADTAVPAIVSKSAVDILVMGTLGRTGIPGFVIGNTAENVVRGLSCSLVALKPAGFVSPVKAY